MQIAGALPLAAGVAGYIMGGNDGRGPAWLLILGAVVYAAGRLVPWLTDKGR